MAISNVVTDGASGSAGLNTLDASSLPNGDFTFMWWINYKAAISSGGFGTPFNLALSNGNYVIAGQNLGSDYLELWDGATSPTPHTSALAITNNKWWHYVLRRTGNVFTLHLSDEGGATYDLAAGATLTLAIPGSFSDFDFQGGDDRVQNLKGWTIVLTDAQARIERERSATCLSTNLWINNKFLVESDLTDYSGNGHDWTEANSLATYAGPSISEAACSGSAPIPVATTLAPITPCDPQTQVGNGGKGQFGCNPGGVGFVPTTISSYGAAIVSADPTDGETLTGKGQVDLWIELVHTDYPTEVQTTYRRSLVELGDLSTYRGGRKAAGLISAGEIEHGLANEQGRLEAATVELVFSDALDRFFRNLLLDQELEGDEIRVCMATPAARAAGTAPRILARAIVQQSPTSSGLEARLTAVDVLFSDSGPFGPDRQWPAIKIPVGVWDNTPPESLELVVPVLYGEKSDEGATNPETNATASKGLIPLIYVGQEDLGSDSVAPPAWEEDATIPTIPTPLTLTNAAFSGGDIHVPVYPWLAAVRDGKISVLPGSYTSTLNPLGVTEPDGIAAAFHFDQVSGGAEYYIGWIADDSSFHPITNPDVGNVGVGTHDDSTFDGWFSNDFTMLIKHLDNAGRITSSNNVWDAYVVHHAAGWSILNLYGSDLGGGVPTNRRDRTLIDTDARGGSDVLGPDWPNWPFADRFRNYTLPDGSSLDLTMIYVRGPLSDDHKNGVVTMTVNAIGIEDVGDGTGDPIMDAHACEQHWIENYLINGYTDGLWATTGPAYEDGTAKVRSSSFLAAQAFNQAALGGRGLTAGWYVDTAKSTLDWAAEWMRDTETRTGTNGHGQVVKFWLDETQDTSAFVRIDHAPDLFGPITRTPGQERENVIPGAACDWDADAEKFRASFEPLKSSAGITKYKNREKAGAALTSTILNITDHLAWVMQRRLARLQFGEALQDITGPLRWLDTDVGSGILLNSVEGVGASGDVDRRYLILRRKTDLDARLVTYSLLDVEDVIVAAEDQFNVSDGLSDAGLLSAAGFVIGA